MTTKMDKRYGSLLDACESIHTDSLCGILRVPAYKFLDNTAIRGIPPFEKLDTFVEGPEHGDVEK